MGVCGQSERIQVGIAIEEALVNAYYHGNLEVGAELRESDYKAFYALAQERTKDSPYKDRRIHVRVRMTRGQAIFTIRDEGPGFDPATLPDPTDAANLEKPGGRGVMLMQAFADEVTYNDQGNEVTLTKSREPEDSVELADGDELE
jgi:anti-sigma regulatory factor (Ser/Thr protein kinase)